MTTYEIKVYDCYIKKCNNEFKKRKNKKDVWFAMTNKITNDYKNGIIKSQNEYIKIMDKLDSDYLNSIENAERNNCHHITVYEGDAELLVGKKYDLIIANINRNILLNDMQVYADCLNEKGILFLSGF